MAKFDIKNFILIVVVSYFLVTILNIFLNQIFPEIPIIKSSFALILLLSAVVLIMLFVTVADKKVEKLEIFQFLLVIATVIGLYWAVKTYIPQIFSIVPSNTKEVFDSIFSILS